MADFLRRAMEQMAVSNQAPDADEGENIPLTIKEGGEAHYHPFGSPASYICVCVLFFSFKENYFLIRVDECSL